MLASRGVLECQDVNENTRRHRTVRSDSTREGSITMKRVRLFFSVICLIVASSWLQARTQVKTVGDKPAAEPLQISLDGQWKLFYLPQGKYQITHPEQLKIQGLTWIEASVPGNVELAYPGKASYPQTCSTPIISQS